MNAPATSREIAEARSGIATTLEFISTGGCTHSATLRLSDQLKRGERHFVQFIGDLFMSSKEYSGWYEVIEAEYPRWRNGRARLGHLPGGAFEVNDKDQTSIVVRC